jgi:leucyl/phenylalanyl-tRNA--protein transferase
MKRSSQLTPEQLLYGYVNGLFPMAEGRRGRVYWYSPDPRAVIPLDTYKPQRSLRPVLNRGEFEIRFNGAFETVMRHCAAPRRDDTNTWISAEIIAAYTELHRQGFAHSVEAYYGGELAGGLYGVSIGGAFFGESMFYLRSNASKVAFHHLVERLRERQFLLLDSQFMNDNVQRYGAIDIPRDTYLELLGQAIRQPTSFV